MRLIKPSYKILGIYNFFDVNPLQSIELAGRTCYKSETGITEDSAEKFVRMIRNRGHHSVLEHSYSTVRIICDRGYSHELVRHRLCAFSQESTRYCNYKGGVTFVIPPWINARPGKYTSNDFGLWDTPSKKWGKLLCEAEDTYINLLALEWTPQQARSVLPNSLKTEIVTSANLREWLHIFNLRTSKAAHPQMREIMIPICKEFKKRIPIIFDEVNLD